LVHPLDEVLAWLERVIPNFSEYHVRRLRDLSKSKASLNSAIP
jgi:hypothetical protein